MKEGTRYRHRVTNAVVEVVNNFHNTLGMVSIINGIPFTVTREDLIRDYIRLDPPRM